MAKRMRTFFIPQKHFPMAVSYTHLFADVESVKAVSDVYSPVSGTVAAIHEELLDSPESINEQPYDLSLIHI